MLKNNKIKISLAVIVLGLCMGGYAAHSNRQKEKLACMAGYDLWQDSFMEFFLYPSKATDMAWAKEGESIRAMQPSCAKFPEWQERQKGELYFLVASRCLKMANAVAAKNFEVRYNSTPENVKELRLLNAKWNKASKSCLRMDEFFRHITGKSQPNNQQRNTRS